MNAYRLFAALALGVLLCAALASFASAADPDGKDTDGDGLPDLWEKNWKLDPYNATGDNGHDGDPDKDDVPNYKEMERHTDPFARDTDGDGVWDNEDEFPNDNSKWKTEEEKETPCWSFMFAMLGMLAVASGTGIALVRKKRCRKE